MRCFLVAAAVFRHSYYGRRGRTMHWTIPALRQGRHRAVLD
jgi:hypothetical protein